MARRPVCTSRERAIRELYNDVRVEGVRCRGAHGTTLYAQFPQTGKRESESIYIFFTISAEQKFENPPAKNSKLQVTCNPYWRAFDKVCGSAG